MANLVGTVRFRSTIDGTNMPKDAQRVGREAGLEGGKSFNEQWDKEFRKGLTDRGRRTTDFWGKRGHLDGLTYGRGVELEFRKFSQRLSSAFDNFQGISVDSDFMDDWIDKSRDWDTQIEELNKEMDLLRRQGAITDSQFRNSTRTINDWAAAQREAGVSAELDRVAQERQADSIRKLNEELARHRRARQNVLDVEEAHRRSLVDLDREWKNTVTLVDRITLGVDKMGKSVDGASLQWGNLSHNTKQWTLIIGAVTAALPELAGLSSAAGSGLLTLGGAAAGAGVGVGVLISSIVGLNKDIDKLPASLRPARAGLDDFKDSFSDLNAVITEAAFLDSEKMWRSLGSTVRSLSPAFAEVGETVGDLFDDFARSIAPGTRNFQNLSGVVRSSAPIFDSLARSVGRVGEGLLSAFNDPAMEQSIQGLLGWIDELTDSFANFLEGGSFDDWLRHGQVVFGSFGELLNTTGRLLNDLVTPESINRLTDFMDNLSTFLDTGGRGILEFADELNAFGLIADLLAEVGEALEPLREPMAELAGILRDQLMAAFDGLAITLSALAQITAPVAQGLATIVDAIPPELVTILAGVAAGTFALSRGLVAIQAAQGAVTALRGISVEGGKAASTLGRVGRGAGLLAAGAAGVVVLATAMDEVYNSIRNFDDISRNAVANGTALSGVWDELGASAFGASYGLTDVSGALDMVGDVGSDISKFFPTFAATFTETGRQASQLSTVLAKLSPELASLANNDVQAATAQFQAYATELGATDEQVLNMLDAMPEFKQALLDVALQTEGTASDQDLLTLAMGGSERASKTNTKQLKDMENQAELTQDQIEDLAGAIRDFGDANLSARDAERQFQAALDDVSDALADNGTTLDINTEQGRANQAALDAVAESTLELAAAKLEQTGKEEDATAAIQEGRDALIRQLAQFGITGQAAEDYADELGLIPDNITTKIAADTRAAMSAVDRMIWDISQKRATIYVDGRPGNVVRPGQVAAYASGGTLYGPQQILAGEAGPEAIVPLNRSLSQVDPSVRWLSAIAQGKVPEMASGGTVGGGRSIVVEAGAVQITGSLDPRRTAVETVDRIVEMAVS